MFRQVRSVVLWLFEVSSGQVRCGRHGWQKQGSLRSGKSWCVRVRFVLARQVRSGELRYFRVSCVKLRYGAAGEVSSVMST